MTHTKLIEDFTETNVGLLTPLRRIDSISKLIPKRFARAFFNSRSTDQKILAILTPCGESMKHVTLTLTDGDITLATRKPAQFKERILTPAISILEMASGQSLRDPLARLHA